MTVHMREKINIVGKWADLDTIVARQVNLGLFQKKNEQVLVLQ